MSKLPKTRAELARLIDHTVLKPETTQTQIERLCDECLQYNFAAACVNPIWVTHCVRRLAGSETVVASVAGFPLGATAPEAKAYEASMAAEQGAREIDMVVNLGALLGCHLVVEIGAEQFAKFVRLTTRHVFFLASRSLPCRRSASA